MCIYIKTIYCIWIKQEVYNLFSWGFLTNTVLLLELLLQSLVRKNENTIKEVQEVLIKTKNFQFFLGENEIKSFENKIIHDFKINYSVLYNAQSIAILLF